MRDFLLRILWILLVWRFLFSHTIHINKKKRNHLLWLRTNCVILYDPSKAGIGMAIAIRYEISWISLFIHRLKTPKNDMRLAAGCWLLPTECHMKIKIRKEKNQLNQADLMLECDLYYRQHTDYCFRFYDGILTADIKMP